MAQVLTPQAADFPQWYQDVLAKAKLAENGPVRGTMVIRPNGYGLWERVQRELDDRLHPLGVRNAYFPLLIPHSYLRREAEHLEGFSPELAVVTQAGGKALEEPLVLRPTSETIINSSFARWIQSYRDLPLLLNQWSNVVRWELRPRIFLRTSEFLWQEGHTCHATQQEARAFAQLIAVSPYREVATELLAIPVHVGAKTDNERFVGAIHTYTLEGMMRDGKALQMATSHELGQNFAKAFDTRYLSEQGTREYVWQTSWGASTRLLGALIMCHGDDSGLRLPPAIAPDQVAVVPVKRTPDVMAAAERLHHDLTAAGLRSVLDRDTSTTFGRRVVDWELCGVPVRVELGPRELQEGKVTIARRDLGQKTAVPLGDTVATCEKLLPDIQRTLLAEATRRRDDSIVAVDTLEDARQAAQTGWARVPYDVVRDVEAEGELGPGLSIRCLQRTDGTLPESTQERELIAFVGRSY